MKTEFYFRRTQQQFGFTLVEVLVSVALLSLVAAYFITAQINQVRERMVESIAQDVLSLANSSMAYFIQTDEWPDQAGNCGNLVAVLAAADAFPAGAGGYTGPNDVTLDADCSNLGSVGSTLRITVEFPAGSGEDADMLMSLLPTAARSTSGSGEPRVTHYVATPRRASGRYTFHKATLEADSAFFLTKPDCPGGGSNPAYIVIPQAVCISGGSNGLGGYYFAEISGGAGNQWRLQLRVANGTNNGLPNNFASLGDGPTCGGQPIMVGAVTFCD
ncbi:type II secretion system protein [Ketobacter sp.]|uniref:type II secretion system protein n=1 Tax=Ketobacter sp. TaxID=2083498 RepID=UPI000F112F96|nr:type II secretion system protein [Ketobacter sp.]RLU00525.1 MAG: type II secretion system protein [Ketobacter sp.]